MMWDKSWWNCFLLFSFQRPHQVDIFGKYNDIGGRLSKEGEVKDGLHPEGSPSNQKATPGSAKSQNDIPRGQSAKETTQDDVKSLNATSAIVNDDNQGQKDAKRTDNNGNRKRLSVSRESKQSSSSGSAKSLPQDDSSSTSLPKIDLPRSRSPRRASATSPLPSDFKLPAISGGRSLVSPDFSNETKVATQSEEDARSERSETLDVGKDSDVKDIPLPQNTGGTDTDGDKDVHLVAESIPKPSVQNHAEVQPDIQSKEQPESNGFVFDEEISPVSTPLPMEDGGDVAEMDVSLSTCREQVYQGYLDRVWPIPSRIIRVYISSTFLGKRIRLSNTCAINEVIDFV